MNPTWIKTPENWTSRPNLSRPRSHYISVLSLSTFFFTTPVFCFFFFLHFILIPSLCSPSPFCPPVSAHSWHNDSQLSAPRRLSWPQSRPDSSADEITHRMSLAGQSSVSLSRSYFRWHFFLLLIHLLFLSPIFLCLVPFFSPFFVCMFDMFFFPLQLVCVCERERERLTWGKSSFKH